MDLSLSGRIALITGASSGFGAHFARLFVREGARVVIGARGSTGLLPWPKNWATLPWLCRWT